MRYWIVRCPHCKSIISQGTGYGDKLPKIWVPFLRCEVCGKLASTGSFEYLTMPVEARTRLKRNRMNIGYIKESLDRTCNSTYVSLLQEQGFTLYPISNADREYFTEVQFDRFVYGTSSYVANELLRNTGILIEEDSLDPNTGGFRQDILNKNKKEYKTDKKIWRISMGVGIAVLIILFFAFGSIDPDSSLCFLSIPIGLGVMFALLLGLDRYYKRKENNAESNVVQTANSENGNIKSETEITGQMQNNQTNSSQSNQGNEDSLKAEMKYRKCPQCGLNYITGEDEICEFCQKKLNVNSSEPESDIDFTHIVRGHVYGNNSRKIYEAFCETLGWDREKSNQFGWQTPLYAANADKKRLNDVWFIFYPNYDVEKLNAVVDNHHVVNLIQNEGDVIIETVEEFIGESNNANRITFVKTKKGYEFLGVYSIIQNGTTRIYKRISDNYPLE